MTQIERLRPDPIPAIHPLPEYLASGQRKAWYEDTRQVLQVPWMGVVTMAYSHYPNFFGELWRGLKPLCESRPFVEAFLDLRKFVETETALLNPQPLVKELADGLNHKCIPERVASYLNQNIKSLHLFPKMAVIRKGKNDPSETAWMVRERQRACLEGQ